MTLSYSHGTTSTAAPMLTAYIAAKNLAFPRVRTLKIILALIARGIGESTKELPQGVQDL